MRGRAPLPRAHFSPLIGRVGCLTFALSAVVRARRFCGCADHEVDPLCARARLQRRWVSKVSYAAALRARLAQAHAHSLPQDLLLLARRYSSKARVRRRGHGREGQQA